MTELQKASLSKRIAAGLLDAMLICVVATGVFALLMWMLGFDAQTQKLTDYQNQYLAMYQVDQDAVGSLEGEAKAKYDKAMEAFYADDEAMRQLSLVISQTMLMVTISILLGMTAVDFVGERFDLGSKLGYLTANVVKGLVHPETADAFRAFLREIAQKL